MLSNRTRLVLYPIALLAFTTIVPSSARMAGTTASASVRAFQERVSEYTRLRRQIVEHLQMSGLVAHGATDTAFRVALARAIQDARRHAGTGDVFGVEITDRILQSVRIDMSARQPVDRLAILSDMPAVPRVRVNDCYPEGAPFATMPPLLLIRLVPLPPELQYRFLMDAVILLDVDANLIVDLIPHALRRST